MYSINSGLFRLTGETEMQTKSSVNSLHHRKYGLDYKSRLTLAIHVEFSASCNTVSKTFI